MNSITGNPVTSGGGGGGTDLGGPGPHIVGGGTLTEDVSLDFVVNDNNWQVGIDYDGTSNRPFKIARTEFGPGNDSITLDGTTGNLTLGGAAYTGSTGVLVHDTNGVISSGGAAGTGDVVGTTVEDNNILPRYSGNTGKAIKGGYNTDRAPTLSNSGQLTLFNNFTLLEEQGGGDIDLRMIKNSSNANQHARFSMDKANVAGAVVNDGEVPAGAQLGQVAFRGWDGLAVDPDFQHGVQLRGTAAETFSAAGYGSTFEVRTNANGETGSESTILPRIEIDSAGATRVRNGDFFAEQKIYADGNLETNNGDIFTISGDIFSSGGVVKAPRIETDNIATRVGGGNPIAIAINTDGTLNLPQHTGTGSADVLVVDGIGDVSVSGKTINTAIGTGNFYIGVGAGGSLQAGSSNNFLFGDGAGAAATTNVGLVAIGANAADLVEPLAINNTAIGSNTLRQNINGVANTAVGTGCLASARGLRNTAVGATALTGNGNGAFPNTQNDNTAIGAACMLQAHNCSSNTGIGSGNLQNLTTGTNNTSIGALAGNGIGNGGSNTIVGYNSDVGGPADSNVTIIGSNIQAGSNEIAIGGAGSTVMRAGTTAVDLGSGGFPWKDLRITGTIHTGNVLALSGPSVGNAVGGAGGASAPPATPQGYMNISIGGTPYKIACYNN